MSRTYSDLHLHANPNLAQRLIAKAANLGYRQIAIPFSATPTETELLAIKTFAQANGIDFVARADFKPRNQEDLTRFLRKFRRKFEVICILCDSKEISRQAAKDHRVDILNFSSLDYKKRFFDRAEAELASNTEVTLEIDAKPLLTLEGPPRTRLLSTLRREAAIAKEFQVPLLISSGVSEELLMRKPHDMAALGFLFGLQEETCLDAVSSNPAAIVIRNRGKLNSKFVAPGVTLLKEGTAK
jgi:RNase P/RNase MRP subunit p30